MASKYLCWYCRQIDGYCTLSRVCDHLLEKHHDSELKFKVLKSVKGVVGYQTISFGIIPKMCEQEGKKSVLRKFSLLPIARQY